MNLKEFLELMTLDKYSENTKNAYAIYFNKLSGMGGLSQENINSLCQSYNNNVTRSFLKLVLRYKKNNTFEVPKIRGRHEKRLPKWVTLEDVKRMFSEAGLEMKCILLLGFVSGLRVSEMLNITLQNVYQKRIIGKGNREDYIHVSPQTTRLLEKVAAKKGLLEDERIFRMTRFAIVGRLKRLGKKVLGKDVSPHMLRHGCGRYLRGRGWDIMQIKAFLRHSDISSTAIYSSVDMESVDRKFEELVEEK